MEKNIYTNLLLYLGKLPHHVQPRSQSRFDISCFQNRFNILYRTAPLLYEPLTVVAHHTALAPEPLSRLVIPYRRGAFTRPPDSHEALRWSALASRLHTRAIRTQVRGSLGPGVAGVNAPALWQIASLLPRVCTVGLKMYGLYWI